MDDIVSSTSLTYDDQKKRHSDDNERIMSSEPKPPLTTPPQRSSSIQPKLVDTHDSQPLSTTTWTEKPKRMGHHRTTSTQNGYQQQQLQQTTVKKSNKPHGRRGSLPPVLKVQTQHLQPSGINNNNKLAGVDFSPVSRSPFTTSIPPLPEKGSVSIHINHPTKSDILGRHLIQPQHENILKNLSYILLWYFFSTTLSLYNKNLMGRDRFNFQFPLLVSAIHAGIHSVITWLMMTFGGDRWRKNSVTSTETSTTLSSGKDSSISDGSLSTYNYLCKVVPCGVAAALEICCANASLVFITLSFYTMVKSSTPVWVLLFSFIFGFEKPRLTLIGIIMVIVSGVLLTVEGETKFDAIGFTLVLVASVVSGLRWNLTQLLLQQDRLGINGPIATLYYLSPIMFVTMLFLSFLVEHPIDQFRQSEHFDNPYHILESFGLMAIGGLLAFAMLLAELALIKSTNTVTLSVAGISKELVVITLSVVIYGDVLTANAILG
ncbi:triose-phosphate transporter family-domain-containing protein [Chlamydoabsidia padenii]|nr:triose-phosphate transporter family-domain-containing protein [Chlamydoabsidia padenii]